MTYKCPDCGNGINFNHQGCDMSKNKNIGEKAAQIYDWCACLTREDAENQIRGLLGREPPADLSLDAIKKDAVIWYDKNFNKGVTMPTDREVMYRYIDYLASQGRISGVSKEGEE